MTAPLAEAPTSSRRVNLREAADIGIALCRKDEWKEGLVLLGRVAARDRPEQRVPAEIYAYLGYGCARFEHEIRAGLILCRRAVNGAGDHPDGYLFLAKVHLLVKQRREAVRWLHRGLRAVPNSADLLALRREIGVRQRPVFARLSRDNALNRFLGRLRARLQAHS